VETRLESSEALVARLLPENTGDPVDRAAAWEDWYKTPGPAAVLAFIEMANDTAEPDAEILQDAVGAAYIEVERGDYEPRRGIPFTAYVKGIARNKIREARRRAWRTCPLDDTPASLLEANPQRTEIVVERHERLTLLREGITQLPPCRRQVLEAYLSGQSTEEIARALGMSEVTVRQHKSRGVRSLQRYIRHCSPDAAALRH
jgi:RNA polymerase sigma factor (sigma-70 family)